MDKGIYFHSNKEQPKGKLEKIFQQYKFYINQWETKVLLMIAEQNFGRKNCKWLVSNVKSTIGAEIPINIRINKKRNLSLLIERHKIINLKHMPEY